LSSDKPEITIPIERYEDYAILRPTGYLNAMTGDRIDKVCAELLGEGIHYVILNFAGVSMVNTIGISILVGIIEKVIQHNGFLYFTSLAPTDRRIFEVLNLTTVALIFNTDEEAEEHLGRDRQAVRRAEQA